MFSILFYRRSYRHRNIEQCYRTSHLFLISCSPSWRGVWRVQPSTLPAHTGVNLPGCLSNIPILFQIYAALQAIWLDGGKWIWEDGREGGRSSPPLMCRMSVLQSSIFSSWEKRLNKPRESTCFYRRKVTQSVHGAKPSTHPALHIWIILRRAQVLLPLPLPHGLHVVGVERGDPAPCWDLLHSDDPPGGDITTLCVCHWHLTVVVGMLLCRLFSVLWRAGGGATQPRPWQPGGRGV